MISKQEICDKYFTHVNPKHLSQFTAVTPEKHNIEGYIVKKPNFYLGSLLITCVDGKDCEQFVQSFPKIHYQDSENTIGDMNFIPCLEKLDGSNIILYGLKDANGNFIEIVPKSRNMPVADKHLLTPFWQNVDMYPIKKFFERNPDSVIMFEMYGTLNQHEVIYPQVYLDIALIGCYNYEDIVEAFCDNGTLNAIAAYYGFNRPAQLFKIYSEANTYIVMPQEYNRLCSYMRDVWEYIEQPTLYDAITQIKDILEKINKISYDENSRIMTEGVVLNGYDPCGKQIYIKVKPSTIEQKHRNGQSGIPRSEILKEVRKYFDEYGSEVKDIYNEDKNHYMTWITTQLREEFDDKWVDDPRTRKKIESAFFDVWNSMKVPESLQKMCEEIVRENPGRETGELMSIFAHKHPEKRKQARMVFSVMDNINAKMNR